MPSKPSLVGNAEMMSKLLRGNGHLVAALDTDGRTALLRSCIGGHLSVTRILVEAGADVSPPPRSETYTCCISVLHILLDDGVLLLFHVITFSLVELHLQSARVIIEAGCEPGARVGLIETPNACVPEKVLFTICEL